MSGHALAGVQLDAELLNVRSLLRDVADSSPTWLREPVTEAVMSPGKLVRPSLVILAARAAATHGAQSDDRHGVSERTLQYAAAIELIHIASLVHDDILDGATTRRGRPALYRMIGVRQAVLVGDYLVMRALELAGSAADSRDISEGLTAITALIQSQAGEALQGEVFAVEEESLRTYRKRTAGKTASLVALSLVAGARSVDASDEITAVLRHVGYRSGLAFQMIDDVLDVAGSVATLGKAPGSDLRQGIPTIVQIIPRRRIAHRGSRAVRGYDRLRKLCRFPGPVGGTALKRATRITRAIGVDPALGLARGYSDGAIALLEQLPASHERKQLIDFIGFLARRSR